MSTPLHVLILEDDPYDAELEIATLEENGYLCQWERVDNRADFLAHLTPPVVYHLILADYNLPDFDGLTALRLFLEHDLDIPFILVSGTVGEETAIESLKAGATDYVLKDRLARLGPVVKRALQQKAERRGRQRAEEAARLANVQLQQLIHSIDGIVWEAEAETFAFTFVSAQAERLLGYPTSQWVEEPTFWVDHIHPDDRDEAVEYCGSATKAGQDHEFEYRMITKDGRIIWLHDVVTVEVKDNEVVKLRGIMVDTTERRRAAEALRASEEKYRTLFEHLPIPVFTKNRQGVYTSSNAENQKYWATNPIGLTDAELFEPEIAAAIVAADRRVMELDDPVTIEERLVNTPLGDRQVLSRKVPLRDGNGHIIGILGASLDITKRKQLEEQLRLAQKMEAIGQLTAGIAHDFNNLLTAINGFAELIQLKLSSDDPLSKMIAKISDSGQRAANLINQLMTFSRKQIVEPRVLDLNEVVNQTDKMLRHIIGEHIALKTTLSSDLWQIEVDPTQCEQVIVNLAVNARDAMPNGGNLIISTINTVLTDSDVADQVETEAGEYVCLTFTDTGTGMNKAVQARIFEPFFTTKEMGQGTGLGLATVYGIVKQNKGDIHIYSEEGKGTTFKIYLPRTTRVQVPQRHPDVSLEIPTGDETILLVEDAEGVRDLALRVLQMQGYTVLEARNGAEALQLASQYTNSIHLLLTDVVMPGQSGKDLAEKLSESWPNLQVLYMSGYTDDAIAHHGVLDSGVAFLQKPFTSITLARKIRQVLDSPLHGMP